jgi:hypothetical protein
MDSDMNQAARRQAAKDLAKLTRRDKEERLRRVCKAFEVTREDALIAGRALKRAYPKPARWWREHCILCGTAVGPISKLVTYDVECSDMVVCPSCAERPGVKVLDDFANDLDWLAAVSKTFPPRARHPKLPWFHHLLVAPLDCGDTEAENAKFRDYLLTGAEREHVTLLSFAELLADFIDSPPWSQLL